MYNKYYSTITFCNRTYKIKAIDVFRYENNFELLCRAVVFDFVLREFDIEEIYAKINEVIKINEDEKELIRSVVRVVLRGGKIETGNKELAKYAYNLAVYFSNALNENGLLNINWNDLLFWDYIILSILQQEAIKLNNEKVEKEMKKVKRR